MKKLKKLTKAGLDVKTFNDKWSAIQGTLEATAHELVQSDIALVDADRALKAAEVAHKKAVARKTIAEKRLNTLRSNLGSD